MMDCPLSRTLAFRRRGAIGARWLETGAALQPISDPVSGGVQDPALAVRVLHARPHDSFDDPHWRGAAFFLAMRPGRLT
jgi:hypothetical protein